MLDLLGSIWDLFYFFILAPLFIGFIVVSAIAFFGLVVQRLEKSETLNSLMDNYWWGMFLIYWVVGIVVGFLYLNSWWLF